MNDATEAPQVAIPLDEVRTLLAEKDRIVAELSDRAANLAVEVARRDKRLAVQEQILNQKDAEIARLKEKAAAAALPGLPKKVKPAADAAAPDSPVSH